MRTLKYFFKYVFRKSCNKKDFLGLVWPKEAWICAKMNVKAENYLKSVIKL